MSKCLFCKIITRELNAYIISSTDNFVAFLDIHPHAPGHTLVIPKNHYDNLSSFDENLGTEFIKIIKETMLKLARALKTNDFTLGINEGPLAGQAVMHLHFHILPRFESDQGGSIHSVVFNKTEESLEEIYQKIINNEG